jgi:hypothetical protein
MPSASVYMALFDEARGEGSGADLLAMHPKNSLLDT